MAVGPTCTDALGGEHVALLTDAASRGGVAPHQVLDVGVSADHLRVTRQGRGHGRVFKVCNGVKVTEL